MGIRIHRVLSPVLAAGIATGMVAPAIAGAAQPAHHSAVRAAGPAIHWLYNGRSIMGLGTITVRRGHSLYKTVELVPQRTLFNVHLHSFLSAAAEGSSVVITSQKYFQELHKNDRIPVTFRIEAFHLARVGVFNGDLHVDARPAGEAFHRVANDLDFRVDVDRVPVPHPAPVIHWAPANYLGAIAVQRGQTVTETVSFTSNVDLTNATVHPLLTWSERYQGVGLQVAAPGSPISVTANTPVSVTFALKAGRYARLGVYPAGLYVTAAEAGKPVRRLPYNLGFRIHVTGIAPVVRWSPANNLGAIAVHRGETITETVSFTSSVDLANARVVRDLSPLAGYQGVHVTVLSPNAPISVTANTPVSVTFTIAAASWARLASYPADLHVIGSEASGPAGRLPYDLDFRVKVERVPVTTPLIQWTGGNIVSYPTVARGTVVTETATFTSNVDLANVRLVKDLTQRPRGLVVTLVPLASSTVTANTPVQVTITIDATRVKAGGRFEGDIYVAGQGAGMPAPRALHYGLHYAGAVS